MLPTLKQWFDQDTTTSKEPPEERGPTNQGLKSNPGKVGDVKGTTERLVGKRMALEEGAMGVHMDGGETIISEQNYR